MTLQALLEDFAPRPAPSPEAAEEARAVLPEEERLAAFEKGYAEGYDDAARAIAEERAQVGAALAGRLEDLSFTYHEARVAILREVRELLEAVGDGVLPAMGHEGFGATLAEAVAEEIEGRAACSVTISVAPDAVDVVAPLMPEVQGFPVDLRGDADLGEGQAVIGFPDGERELDVGPVVTRALAALAEWMEGAAREPAPDETREAAHG